MRNHNLNLLSIGLLKLDPMQSALVDLLCRAKADGITVLVVDNIPNDDVLEQFVLPKTIPEPIRDNVVLVDSADNSRRRRMPRWLRKIVGPEPNANHFKPKNALKNAHHSLQFGNFSRRGV